MAGVLDRRASFRHPAGGRVFCAVIGHFNDVRDTPLYRLPVLRGIAWCLNEPFGPSSQSSKRPPRNNAARPDGGNNSANAPRKRHPMLKTILLVALLPMLTLCADDFSAAGVKNDQRLHPEVDRIYQFFQPCSETNRPTLGAYLWIPPDTPKIRAVMIGMHNGLPINLLQSPPVRATCRKHGIAQILLTPWAKDIGSVLLKDLTFDVTDPERTAVYDRYLQQLAELSGHPELITAPIVPLGHSAFCGFSFEAAMRKPEQCLGAIPIKAGLPDAYTFFGPGGKAMHPSADYCLRNVPILFVTSSSQETVSWSPYPQAYGTNLSSYRRGDRDNSPGTA